MPTHITYNSIGFLKQEPSYYRAPDGELVVDFEVLISARSSCHGEAEHEAAPGAYTQRVRLSGAAAERAMDMLEEGLTVALQTALVSPDESAESGDSDEDWEVVVREVVTEYYVALVNPADTENWHPLAQELSDMEVNHDSEEDPTAEPFHEPVALPDVENILPVEWPYSALPLDLTRQFWDGYSDGSVDPCAETIPAAEHHTYECTLPYRHTGMHIAGDGHRLIAMWANHREA